jgi:hypothetical protein
VVPGQMTDTYRSGEVTLRMKVFFCSDRRISVRHTRSFTVGTAVAALVGCIGLSTSLVSNASVNPGTAGKHGPPMVMIGKSGNKIEMVDPDHSTYVPNLAAASAKDVRKAQRLLDGVNQFCRTHTVAMLKPTWRPGHSRSTSQTHLFNPVHSQGLNTASPTAALIYDGKVAGEMLNGDPLPYLGTIPRAHGHADMAMAVEMLHVYCTPNLRYAFTPNRQLGVMLPVFHLRLKIRPAVMNLNSAQLQAVVAKVRGYTGRSAATKATRPARGGPDPVLAAMRTEIRRSLMVLSEHQLRSVWRLMQSY